MRARAAVAAGAVMTAAGGALLWHGFTSAAPVPPSLPAPASAQAPPAATAAAFPAAAVARVIPVRVIIPAIGVDAAVVPEGTDSTGALEVPPLSAQNVAGWWDGGAAPGQDGAAVITGHVDNASGPLVFWNLRLLKPGNEVETEPGNHRFTVTRVEQVSKTAFPTTDVYGPTKDPELRLVTCGGTFDPATGHYLSNVIVYAREAA